MALTGLVKDKELALKIGIDTTGPALPGVGRTDELKPVSSDIVEDFRSALEQCDENSKCVIIDAVTCPECQASKR